MTCDNTARYTIYDAFIQWKIANKVNVISENAMLAYFGELAKKFKPPTLWCNYSMLRSTMYINDQIKLTRSPILGHKGKSVLKNTYLFTNLFYSQIYSIYKSIYLQVLFYLQINVQIFRSH